MSLRNSECGAVLIELAVPWAWNRVDHRIDLEETEDVQHLDNVEMEMEMEMDGT